MIKLGDIIEKNNINITDLKGTSLSDLLTLCDNYLWGKIYIGEICDTDFIYFPQGWAHRVYTYEKSIGLSGYL